MILRVQAYTFQAYVIVDLFFLAKLFAAFTFSLFFFMLRWKKEGKMNGATSSAEKNRLMNNSA